MRNNRLLIEILHMIILSNMEITHMLENIFRELIHNNIFIERTDINFNVKKANGNLINIHDLIKFLIGFYKLNISLNG